MQTAWELEFNHNGAAQRIHASVPGNVHLDLMEADYISDPFFGNNVHKLVDWEQKDWRYLARIDVPLLAEGETIFLRFDGIDTLARILINGMEAALSDNMFIPLRVDVTQHSGTRIVLEVEIDSVIAREWKRDRPTNSGALPYNAESSYVRKARHSFGWDIAPRIITAGLWRQVSFETHSAHELDDLYIYTISADRDSATVGIDWQVSLPTGRGGYELSLDVQGDADNTVSSICFPVRFTSGHCTVEIENPTLWWPRGFGEPAMYQLLAKLNVDGKAVDSRRFDFGVRTVKLKRSDALDGKQKDFRIIVNNEPIFARGSNWVPSDAFHSRAALKTDVNLKPYIDSECNILRIWGGGIYEDESLFDACDRAGIMIWQDFMLGCELPPNDAEYHRNIQDEVGEIAQRYRNHPSLALWCGDNENDAAYRQWRGERYDDNRVSRAVIPAVLTSIDPYRPYLPSSPYISEAAWERSLEDDRSITEIIPEHHLWGPRDAFKGDFYRRNTAIFVSEIGYHGCPSVSSIKKFIDSSAIDRRTTEGKQQWVTHATQPYGDIDGKYAYRIELMENQVSMLFGTVPDDLDTFVTASQISQAEAMKYFIEHFRIRKWRKSGIIWWNMQDMWPQFSDSVIDYYGEKKLAWYYITQSQQPVCVAIDEADSWKRDVYGLNDTSAPVKGTYRIHADDGSIKIADAEFRIEANSTGKIGEIPYTDSLHHMLSIEWEYNDSAVGTTKVGRNHYVCAEPPLNLERYVGSWLPRILPEESHWWDR